MDRKVEKRMREVEAAVKRIRTEEGYVQREAQFNDFRTSELLFGMSTARPDSGYLKKRGAQSMLYYSTDTGVLSAWDGANWKGVTLS